jgi:hypothetical protein
MCIVFASFALMLHSAHKIWREEIVKTGGYRDQVDQAKHDLTTRSRPTSWPPNNGRRKKTATRQRGES